jgi:hypothetical protein
MGFTQAFVAGSQLAEQQSAFEAQVTPASLQFGVPPLPPLPALPPLPPLPALPPLPSCEVSEDASFLGVFEPSSSSLPQPGGPRAVPAKRVMTASPVMMRARADIP